jgi:hypothetical protein
MSKQLDKEKQMNKTITNLGEKIISLEAKLKYAHKKLERKDISLVLQYSKEIEPLN